jgi:large subunit ribosomal protein L13
MPTRRKTQLDSVSISDTLRNHLVIDAEGQAVGRVATAVAKILIGKHKPSYVAYLDAGDFVTINNVSKVKFTGKKLVQKDYYHHTMHPGGIKRLPMQHLFEKNPAEVMRKAIYGMLPKNKHREIIFQRLTINS